MKGKAHGEEAERTSKNAKRKQEDETGQQTPPRSQDFRFLCRYSDAHPPRLGGAN